MNRQKTLLTVHPPFPKKQLGRYHFVKGVCLIRQNGTVIYIGRYENIWKGVSRLFQHGGKLAAIDPARCTFEVILSNLQKGTIEIALKDKYLPEYSYTAKSKKNETYRRNKSKRVLAAYYEGSRIAEGEHRTDSEN
jgi:excinuclease UvrABC nuclease subunit